MKDRKHGFRNPNRRTEQHKRIATPVHADEVTLRLDALPGSGDEVTLPLDAVSGSGDETPVQAGVVLDEQAGAATTNANAAPAPQSTAILPSRSLDKARRRRLLKRILVTTISVLALLAVLGAAGWYYLDLRDRENAQFVPSGVTLNGTSLAGLDRAQVTALVEGVISEDRTTEIELAVGKDPVTFALGDFADSDAEALVNEIMAVRPTTPLLDRLAHDYLGREIVAEFETAYLIDTEAIATFAHEVADQYSFPAEDARIYFEGFTPHIAASKNGFLVDAELTAKNIEEVILDNLEGVERTSVSASAEVTLPETMREDLMIPVLTVNIGARQVLLWSGDQLQLTYPCAVGQPAYPTIPGEYYIGAKEVNPTWINPAPDGWGKGAPKMIPGPNDALGLRGLHIFTLEGYDTQMLFHGALASGLAGTATTHGCIRMFNYDVVDLYDRVPVGTPVSLSY